jgi:hypothetical protein
MTLSVPHAFVWGWCSLEESQGTKGSTDHLGKSQGPQVATAGLMFPCASCSA